ncbi:lysylphosphatidylglycerol synthetase family protein [Pseudorhizobium halotolerans]|uniref:Lysylphosphatidylglycerol synthetase family protein n=1 Tax=Pseudorhizobium halotolerans TaxID=1233081 RepID=A0ABN7JUQ8_9HYPH|nr:lysylphosphatidylglycerol synthase domain-containing protein [Pseudorhizobium halotolerans]CAD7046729.1 lysylphosphatidylglycerol synthetase family protein [Pseudorhizobium halotolerans]
MKSDSVATRRVWIMRNAMTLLTLAIIIAYAAFIQWVWGWGSVLALWQTVGLGTGLAALSALLATYVLRAWRIYDYFPQETAGRFGALLRLSQVQNLLNVMLPFRSGEASFPLLMMRDFNISLARGTAALLVMRLFDLHALLAAGGIALALEADAIWAWILWGAFLLLPPLGFMLHGIGLRFAARVLPAKARRLLAEIEAGLPADAAAFFRAWGATLLNWSTKIAVLAWVLGLLGGLEILPGLGGALGGELSSVLPFHAPAGVGTYPAGISVGAIAFGAAATGPLSADLAQAAVNTHLLVIISALVGTTLSLLSARAKP